MKIKVSTYSSLTIKRGKAWSQAVRVILLYLQTGDHAFWREPANAARLSSVYHYCFNSQIFSSHLSLNISRLPDVDWKRKSKRWRHTMTSVDAYGQSIRSFQRRRASESVDVDECCFYYNSECSRLSVHIQILMLGIFIDTFCVLKRYVKRCAPLWWVLSVSGRTSPDTFTL